MRFLCGGIASCVMSAFLAQAASVTSIPITGTGSSNGNWPIFDFVGPDFNATSHGGGGTFGLGFCGNGTCSLKEDIRAFDHLPEVDAGWSMGSFNGAEANFLRGTLFLPSFVTIPPVSQSLPEELTTQGSFHGDLTGFFETPDGINHRLFEVFLTGEVQITLSGFQGSPTESFFVGWASYEFTGTATETPEPGTVFYLATALALVAWRRRMRSSCFSRN